MTAWWSSASLTFRHRQRKVTVLMQYVSGVMFRYGTPVITTGIKLERLPRAMYTILAISIPIALIKWLRLLKTTNCSSSESGYFRSDC